MNDQNLSLTNPETNSMVENVPVPQEGNSISGYVKQEVVSQIVEMGFSKNVAEKACFFTQSNLENAINWIEEHQKDADFEEELRVVGQEENKAQLTEEEIKQKAKELQELARKRYVQKQKELEEEQERNRIRISKNKFYNIISFF
jgi:uncharacterized UBP type Zn finger protein